MGSVLRGLNPPSAASSPRRPPHGVRGSLRMSQASHPPVAPAGRPPAAQTGPEANRSGAVRVISVSGYNSSEAVSARPFCLRSLHGVPTTRGVRSPLGTWVLVLVPPSALSPLGAAQDGPCPVTRRVVVSPVYPSGSACRRVFTFSLSHWKMSYSWAEGNFISSRWVSKTRVGFEEKREREQRLKEQGRLRA